MPPNWRAALTNDEALVKAATVMVMERQDYPDASARGRGRGVLDPAQVSVGGNQLRQPPLPEAWRGGRRGSIFGGS